MRSRRSAREDLRTAVACLPRHTREAMLEGVRDNDIIVGAYVDRSGGVCPMLAAHRCGGRTDFLAFARAWDGFAGARNRARRASERELRVLVGLLEASLLEEDVDLGRAIADHQATARERRAREASRVGFGWLRRGDRAPEPDRSRELVER